ncbi:hypothetical protein C6T66_02380 [Burkholderia multivorans]|nr:hypothetical protein C6T66_02380 [Burkholderia multivorans]
MGNCATNGRLFLPPETGRRIGRAPILSTKWRAGYTTRAASNGCERLAAPDFDARCTGFARRDALEVCTIREKNC